MAEVAPVILELVGAVAGTGLVVGPSCLYAGAKFREHIPIRVPTNRTRIDDAETDLRLMEIARERRQLDFNIEHDRLKAEQVLDEARTQAADRERRALVQSEGENHKVLEARLLDAVRRAFPGEPWGTVRNADDLLERLESAAAELRRSEDETRTRAERLRDELRRARTNGRLPKYLADAAYEAGLL